MPSILEVKRIKSKQYYSADELMQLAVIFFKGCRSARMIVSKKDIPEDHYTYGMMKGDKLIKRDGSSKKLHKLYLSKEWVEENIPEFNTKIEYEVEMAPNVIQLEENEMFRDSDDNVLDIEVRGEREFDKCYFKVKDIMRGFSIKSLYTNILDPKSGFIINRDYIYFNVTFFGLSKNNVIKKTLFLTYTGLLRVLFASRKNTADKFVKWASDTLFTVHLGKKNQKEQLSANLLGVSTNAIKAVFNKTATELPCIYLFTLGKVSNLRKSLKISNDDYGENDYVVKWGMTDNLERRTKEHEKTFSKIRKSKLELLIFAMVDPQYVSKAETKIKHVFEETMMKITHNTYTELAILPQKKLKFIKEQFSTISEAYIGRVRKIQDEMEKLKKDHIIKILEKDNEISYLKGIYESEKRIYETESLKKRS